jgi:hypothetical protein
MDLVFRFVADRAAALNGHPFLCWARYADVSLDQRLAVLTVLAPFAMGYQDACTWARRYRSPRDDLETAINLRAAEGAAHAGFFLEDWAALGLDEVLGLRASDVLWWLFIAPETATIRRASTQMLAMPAADAGDPLLRAAWTEAIEACTAILFAALAPLAAELADRTGRQYPYMGGGGLVHQGGRLASVFAGQKLSGKKRARAIDLAARMFSLFEAVFDSVLEYGAGYPAARQALRRPRFPALARPDRPRPRRLLELAPVNPAAQSLLDHRRERTARHPLYQWLSSSEPPGPAAKLTLLVPDRAVTIMRYGEVLQVLCGQPATGQAATLYSWAGELAGRGAVFLADWAALGVDEQLGWTASQTLRWLYMNPHSDRPRRNMATFIRLAASCRSPLVRLWLLVALEASSEPWFAATRPLALTAEREQGIELDYLSGRCEGPGPVDASFRQARLTACELGQVLNVIRLVFDAVDKQLEQTPAGAIPPACTLPASNRQPLSHPHRA